MVEDFAQIPRSERIIVALDCNHEEAIAIAKELKGFATWVKVGMTLYYACGPRIVEELNERLVAGYLGYPAAAEAVEP